MAQAEKTVRLQKIIARSGVASRRKAEELIQHGLVTVNGETVMTLGTKVDPAVDHIKVEGRHLKSRPPDMFLMLNKPVGYISTLHDPAGRPTIKALVPKPSIRLFPVGRLDYDSEGLLLLTNNGDIAQACLHPAHHVHKTYLVKIKGILEEPEIQKLRHGLMLEDGPTAPAKVKKAGKAAANSWVEITIHEGRKHQVKRMFEQIGHPVIRLKRVQFGPLNLGTLPPGQTRYLTDKEANDLRHLLIAPESPGPTVRQPKTPNIRLSRPAGQFRPRPATPNSIRSKHTPSPAEKAGQTRPWTPTRPLIKKPEKSPTSRPATPSRPRSPNTNSIKRRSTSTSPGTIGQAGVHRSKDQPINRRESFPKSGPAGQFWPRQGNLKPIRSKQTISTPGRTGNARPRRPGVTSKSRFKFKT
ncbi:pseudouridine synthase [Nitrospira sp. T9]|uniref:pseudouridine synthase n=1 Tax=unclassified Nitrospira TaxID=2652172 RepID=UPI003F97B4B0